MRRLLVLLSTIAVCLFGSIVPAEASSFSVSAKLSKGWMTLGTTVGISGTVSPAVNHKTVEIQQYNGARWVTIKKTQTTSSGKYLTAIKPTLPGDLRLRAKTAAYGGRSGGVSTSRMVKVYMWISLDDVWWDMDEEPAPLPPATVAGRSFTSAWVSAAAPVAGEKRAWPTSDNQGRKCWKLSGYAGLTDASGPGAEGELSVHTDGSTTAYPVTTGSLTRIVVDLTWRFDLSATRTGPDVDTYVALGDPKAFCNAPKIMDMHH
jgi:hypothetical protein